VDNGALNVADRPTFFVDRSLGKKVGRSLREAGATVEFHDDHFPQTALDKDWIPIVSKQGWVILTKDKNIRRPSGEREDLVLANARVFTLTSGNISGSEMANLYIQHLAAIEQIATSERPPFAYTVGPNGLQHVFPESPTPPAQVNEIPEET